MNPHRSPGAFVDIHCHGGAGVEINGETDPTPALELHARHGTGALVASLVSAPIDRLEAQLSALAAYRRARPDTILAGVHLEGPFLAASHRGAHDPAHLVSPTADLVDRLLGAGDGLLRQVTLAPELPGALQAIRDLTAAGVRAAVGHTGADYAQARGAFEAGATLLTHAFNAMPGLHHRAPGPVAAALDTPEVTLEVIADGVHVHAPLLRLLFIAAPERIAVVTDALSPTGCTGGTHRLGDRTLSVLEGRAVLAGTEILAGSTLTMDRSAAHLESIGISAAAIRHATTTTPARALGLRLPVGAGTVMADPQGQQDEGGDRGSTQHRDDR